MRRSVPKHSTSDFIKAMSIAGITIAVIAALFALQVDDKPLINYIVDQFGTSEKAQTVDETKPQMDRYTDQEQDGLDKLIKEKSK